MMPYKVKETIEEMKDLERENRGLESAHRGTIKLYEKAVKALKLWELFDREYPNALHGNQTTRDSYDSSKRSSLYAKAILATKDVLDESRGVS